MRILGMVLIVNVMSLFAMEYDENCIKKIAIASLATKSGEHILVKKELEEKKPKKILDGINAAKYDFVKNRLVRWVGGDLNPLIQELQQQKIPNFVVTEKDYSRLPNSAVITLIDYGVLYQEEQKISCYFSKESYTTPEVHCAEDMSEFYYLKSAVVHPQKTYLSTNLKLSLGATSTLIGLGVWYKWFSK